MMTALARKKISTHAMPRKDASTRKPFYARKTLRPGCEDENDVMMMEVNQVPSKLQATEEIRDYANQVEWGDPRHMAIVEAILNIGT